MDSKTVTMPLLEYNSLSAKAELTYKIERLMEKHEGMDYRITVWQDGSHIDMATTKASEITKELAEANHRIGSLAHELDKFREMSLWERIKYHFKIKK